MSSFRSSAWRRRAFMLVVGVTLALFGFVGVVLIWPERIAGFLPHDPGEHIAGHFRFIHHRVHDLIFGFLMATAAVGMLAQLRRPADNVASQLMALIPWAALLVAFVLAGARLPFAPAPILGGLTVLAAVLHPAGRDFFGSFDLARISRLLLGMVAIAAVPLLAMTITNIGWQQTLTNDHAQLGHYGFMAAFGFTVIGVGLLASLRPVGWRLTAWVAGALPVLFGFTSLLYPNVDSSLDFLWALAALGWGVGFIAAAEITRGRAI